MNEQSEDLTTTLPDSWRQRSGPTSRQRAAKQSKAEPGDVWFVFGWLNIALAIASAGFALALIDPPIQLGVLVLSSGDLVFGGLCLIVAELKRITSK